MNKIGSLLVCVCTCVYPFGIMRVCFFSTIVSFRLGFQFSHLVEIFLSSLFVCNVSFIYLFSAFYTCCQNNDFSIAMILAIYAESLSRYIEECFFEHGVKGSLRSLYMGYMRKLRPGWQSKT